MFLLCVPCRHYNMRKYFSFIYLFLPHYPHFEKVTLQNPFVKFEKKNLEWEDGRDWIRYNPLVQVFVTETNL